MIAVRVLIRHQKVAAGGYLKKERAFALWTATRSSPEQEWEISIFWVLLPGVVQPSNEGCEQAIIQKLVPKKRRGK